MPVDQPGRKKFAAAINPPHFRWKSERGTDRYDLAVANQNRLMFEDAKGGENSWDEVAEHSDWTEELAVSQRSMTAVTVGVLR